MLIPNKNKKLSKINGSKWEQIKKPVVSLGMSGKQKITNEMMTEDILRVAVKQGTNYLPASKYRECGKFSLTNILTRFSSWNNAVKQAGLENKSLGGQPRPSIFTRHKISKDLQFKILKRDRFKCCLCGASPATDDSVELHIDHSLPVALGGKNDYWNLWVLCSKCNMKKLDNYNHEYKIRTLCHILECEERDKEAAEEMLLKKLENRF